MIFIGRCMCISCNVAPFDRFVGAATVFGSCHKLEPLPAGKKAMWTREMDCLLSVCDYIVQFYPSTQTLPDGTKVEVHCTSFIVALFQVPIDIVALLIRMDRFVQVMATRPRSDIYINLPALEKLDAMLIVRIEIGSQTRAAPSIDSALVSTQQR